MIGDKRITLLTFFAAAFLHLVILVLASYTPWRLPELEPPKLPIQTRYVVRFRQPAPTVVPTPVPDRPEAMQPIDPVLPHVQPRTREPVPIPQPVRIQEQSTRPTAIEVRRPKPLDPVAQPKPIAPRKPSAVKIPRKRPKRVVTPKPVVPKQPVRKAPAPTTPTVVTPKPARPREPVVSKRPAPPTARPTQTVAPATQDLQRRYLAMVSAALQRHKRYPRTARRRGLSGKVVLTFVVLPDGQVTDARIADSTGHTILNNAALRALRRATPLPPFPSALKRPSLRVTIPILYELTEK